MAPWTLVYVAVSFSSNCLNTLVYCGIKCGFTDETRMKRSTQILETEWNHYYALPTRVFLSCFTITRISDYSYILSKLLLRFWKCCLWHSKIWGGIGYKKETWGTYRYISIKHKINHHYNSSNFVVRYFIIHTFLLFTRIATIPWSSKARIRLTHTFCCRFALPTATF